MPRSPGEGLSGSRRDQVPGYSNHQSSGHQEEEVTAPWQDDDSPKREEVPTCNVKTSGVGAAGLEPTTSAV